MKVGLIARADDGGLGTMTAEFFRHLHPERTLVVDLGPLGRGPLHPERFPGAMVNVGMNEAITVNTLRRFLTGLDVVYTAETWYRDDLPAVARSLGVATVLHAMPELYRADQAPADAIWLPTTWERDRMPARATVVPVPIAVDRLRPRQRTEATTFLFVQAPAFHDRNGMQLVIDAAAEVRQSLHLVIAGPVPPPPIRTAPGVTVTHDPTPVADYWARYAHADVLVLPRRYAGLSLPMAEAAGSGAAVVSLDLPPQNEWVPPWTLVHATEHHRVRMAGGTFAVHTCTPSALAAVMDALVIDPVSAYTASTASLAYGAEMSWERQAPVYRAALESAVERTRTATLSGQN